MMNDSPIKSLCEFFQACLSSIVVPTGFLSDTDNAECVNKCISKEKEEFIVWYPLCLDDKKPEGVIQFIGGFIAGSFDPECSYQHLFEELCGKRGYTIVIYKFPFLKNNHFEVAKELINKRDSIKGFIANNHLKAIKELKSEREIPKDKSLGRAHEDFKDFYEDDSNYHWLTHSLGCRLLILLESLSNKIPREDIEQNCNLSNKDKEFILEDSSYIFNQSSIFLAPEIHFTWDNRSEACSSNNLLHRLAYLFNEIIYFFFKTSPNRERTQLLTQEAFKYLFGISKVIAFTDDVIAFDDVISFMEFRLVAIESNLGSLKDKLLAALPLLKANQSNNEVIAPRYDALEFDKVMSFIESKLDMVESNLKFCKRKPEANNKSDNEEIDNEKILDFFRKIKSDLLSLRCISEMGKTSSVQSNLQWKKCGESLNNKLIELTKHLDEIYNIFGEAYNTNDVKNPAEASENETAEKTCSFSAGKDTNFAGKENVFVEFLMGGHNSPQDRGKASELAKKIDDFFCYTRELVRSQREARDQSRTN